jgi:hypothetical protein
VDSGSVTIVSSAFSFNQCSGDGGRNGATEGNGGAVFNLGEFYVTNCTFLSNEVIGGIGRLGSKPGNGGAIYNLSLLTAVNTTFDKNSAIGGRGYASLPPAGSAGTNGNGGAIYSTGTVAMVNCTLFRNMALGGDGANVGGQWPTVGGVGYGGGLFLNGGVFTATNSTLAENSAKGGLDGTMPIPGGVPTNAEPGLGGALYISTGGAATVVNTILANSLSGSNCFGTLTDAGHNISSDGSCNFTAAGSLNNTDPKLGPFGNYGGPTPTIPLLSGSPAMDAGDAAACPGTDQRGISRPYGSGCDIGAFESAPPYTVNGHIHGYLSPSGVGVSVGSNSVGVDASGFYTFTGLDSGTYPVTPSAPETRFVPGRRVVKVGPDSTGVDFTAYRLNALTVETTMNLEFQVVFAGEIETTYRTEVSTNLVNWSFYSSNSTDTNGVFVITNIYFGSGNPTFLRVVKP